MGTARDKPGLLFEFPNRSVLGRIAGIDEPGRQLQRDSFDRWPELPDEHDVAIHGLRDDRDVVGQFERIKRIAGFAGNMFANQLEVLAADKYLISRRRDRLFKTEESSACREVKRAGAPASRDANLICSIADVLVIDDELAWRA